RSSRSLAASGVSTLPAVAGSARDNSSHREGVTMEQISGLFTTLLNAATSIGLAAAALFLAWAGFLYMTAGGSPRRMETAKDAAFAAIGGLAVVLLASTIANLVQGAVHAS